jgi:hypothetical protein
MSKIVKIFNEQTSLTTLTALYTTAKTEAEHFSKDGVFMGYLAKHYAACQQRLSSSKHTTANKHQSVPSPAETKRPTTPMTPPGEVKKLHSIKLIDPIPAKRKPHGSVDSNKKR